MKQNPAAATRRSSGTERAARDDMQKRNRKTEQDCRRAERVQLVPIRCCTFSSWY
ncbi:hypothetical protein LINGRAHAP2_LOCUS29993 [Linum grandiflorum]